jgi:hypothetical protein
MVFDHAGRHLYITTTDGFVWPYNLSTGQVEPAYNLGGSLNGLDIADDDSFLLVAQRNTTGLQGTVHKLNLANGVVTDLHYALDVQEGGAWDVAVSKNGIALFSTFMNGSGGIGLPFRQIDLATNAITVRSDVSSNGRIFVGKIHRNASGTILYLGSAYYDATTDSFSWAGAVGAERAAVSRNGALVALGIGNSVSVNTIPDYNLVHVFSHFGSGLACDGVTDRLFAATVFTNEIVVYDATTFVEQFRFAVGEELQSIPHEFEGTLVATDDGRYLAIQTPSGVRLITVPAVPPPRLPPTLDSPTTMLFDHKGQYLYLVTFLGRVWPYNLATHRLETPFTVDGVLFGADIAPDDSFLLLAQYYRGVHQGTIQKLDLHTGVVTNLLYPLNFAEQGSFDVAIGLNGRALFTTNIGGGHGILPLRQIDLATNTITVRNDVPSYVAGGSAEVSGITYIHRSADGTRFLFFEDDMSTGPEFTYNAITDAFGPGNFTNFFYQGASGAVNRNGTLLATRLLGNTYITAAPDFNAVRQLTTIDAGVAFNALSDILYGVDGINNRILSYDTNTFSPRISINIGEDVPEYGDPFDVGTLSASQDGRYLSLITPSGVRLIDVTAQTSTLIAAIGATPAPPPTPTPIPTSTPIVSVSSSGSVSEGQGATFTISATSNTVRPVTVSYTMSGSAAFGTDYTVGNGFAQSGSAIISVGQNSVSIAVAALTDQLKEKKETITMTLNPGPGYSFGNATKKRKPKPPAATVTIAANQS